MTHRIRVGINVDGRHEVRHLLPSQAQGVTCLICGCSDMVYCLHQRGTTDTGGVLVAHDSCLVGPYANNPAKMGTAA
jgi:hypothetical protein